MRVIGLQTKRGMVALAMIALVSIVAVVFWPHAPVSPAERQARNWLNKGYRGGIGGKDWQELEGFGPDTLPFLVAALTNRSEPPPRYLRNTFRRLPFLSHHMDLLYDPEAERFAASSAIFNFPSNAHVAMVATVMPVLGDERVKVRERAAETLSARIRPADRNWLPDLVAKFGQETNRYVRLRLAIAIGKINPGAQVVSEIVRPALHDTNSLIRAVAQEQLPQIEKIAAEHNP